MDTPNLPKVFISFSGHIRTSVASLVKHLRSKNDFTGIFKVIYDADIPPGETWRSKLDEMIETCVVAIVAIEKEYFEPKSTNTLDELEKLLKRRQRDKIHILPIIANGSGLDLVRSQEADTGILKQLLAIQYDASKPFADDHKVFDAIGNDIIRGLKPGIRGLTSISPSSGIIINGERHVRIPWWPPSSAELTVPQELAKSSPDFQESLRRFKNILRTQYFTIREVYKCVIDATELDPVHSHAVTILQNSHSRTLSLLKQINSTWQAPPAVFSNLADFDVFHSFLLKTVSEAGNDGIVSLRHPDLTIAIRQFYRWMRRCHILADCLLAQIGEHND